MHSEKYLVNSTKIWMDWLKNSNIRLTKFFVDSARKFVSLKKIVSLDTIWFNQTNILVDSTKFNNILDAEKIISSE